MTCGGGVGGLSECRIVEERGRDSRNASSGGTVLNYLLMRRLCEVPRRCVGRVLRPKWMALGSCSSFLFYVLIPLTDHVAGLLLLMMVLMVVVLAGRSFYCKSTSLLREISVR